MSNKGVLYTHLLVASIIFFVVGFTQIVFAKDANQKPNNSQTNFVTTSEMGAEYQLEVRQMPLVKVLEDIFLKSKIPLHYSVLPEGLVTATCVGTTLKKVLECLLDHKADLIVRYQNNADKDKQKIAEAWILGSKISYTNESNTCSITSENNLKIEVDQTSELLKLSESKDPKERVEAISALLSAGRPGDPAVKAALERALTDQEDSVRAQAISSLARREGAGAKAILQKALHDNAVDVRMMAVDGITDDISLLQEAINDKDETIRALATLKLEQLIPSNITPLKE